MKTLKLVLALVTTSMLTTPVFAGSDTVESFAKDTKTESGLVAHYYRDKVAWDGNWPAEGVPTVSASAFTFTEYSYSRVEPLVNHLFIKRGWFSVRWKGVLSTSSNGKKDEEAEYTFHIWADDGCRLVIDGRTIIDSWAPAWEKAPESHRKATIKLTPGDHRIVIEYFQGPSLVKDDKDPIKVSWECKERKIPKQIIPASHFSHLPEDSLPGKSK